MLQNAAAPVAFGRVLSNIFDTVNKFKRKWDEHIWEKVRMSQ
jgi:hypothetical protein